MSQFLLQKKLCFETGTHPPFGPMSQNTQFFFEGFPYRLERLSKIKIYYVGEGLDLGAKSFYFLQSNDPIPPYYALGPVMP